MVDALVSGASVERRVGSTPILGTTKPNVRRGSKTRQSAQCQKSEANCFAFFVRVVWINLLA